ncbi:MAG: BamA/TamA family outer membrane protein [Aphanothece sp. CMT-3BRIN-NPC111]|nr:BamA/TamA family outer membrane protein [Aphanothece sp. CMT-3BRIN-NPC111]
MRLSPLLLAVFAASTTLSLSTPASGKTVKSAPKDAQQIAGSSSEAPVPQNVVVQAVPTTQDSPNVVIQAVPTTQDSPNVVVQAVPITQDSPAVLSQDTPATPPVVIPPNLEVPTEPSPGTESTPQQETPNRVEFDVTPGAPSLENINPPSPSPTPQPTSPPSTTTQPAQPEARVLVAEVQVSGVQGELRDEVYRAIRTQAGRVTTRAQLQEDVNAIYATGYFANVTFAPEDTPLGVRVTFVVQPNPVLQNVGVTTVPPEGKRVLPQQVVNDIFAPQYGRILNLNDLQEGIKKLNQWYKDNGYDLAQVVDAPKVDESGTVNLVVAEGVIENVEVRFLDKEGEATNDEGQPIGGRTRQFIITREVQLKPGDIFNRKTAEKDLRRVYGLGIFEDVRLSFNPGQDPRKVVVVVNAIEKKSGSLAAGLGVSSASGLFGTVSYQQQNLGGNNQKVGAEVQLGQRDLLFNVNFTDPWIAGDPYRTSYTVDAFRRRSISLIFDGGDRDIRLGPEHDGDRPRVVRLGSDITFSRPLTRDVFGGSEWRASLGLQYQRISIRDSDGDLAPTDEFGNNLSFSGSGRDDLLSLQLGAVRDRRNNPATPTQGSLLRVGVEQSIPIGEGNILMNRLRGSYSYYIPVNFTRFKEGPQALAFNIQGGTVLGDLPPYEAFSLGGSNSVRGYEEGDVGSGRSFIQATAEYRFPIFSVVGGALFLDAATDLGSGNSVPGDPAGVRGKPGNGFGYGLGVRVQSPLGPIRVDYGFNDNGESRLHFGIGERF